ncbi:UNVERIFIED_ORG: oxidoreductase [Clostridium botulinum]|uniref:SDR family oxidoreductase n=1 Tax=Clostridium botulinum TaxID=1491 RepID=A0A6B4MTA6_CLOBO|nr:SDR family NAD(P)-dependent oxidoreductase [Clostridium botulinum]MBY6809228.1 SDR family oxidoreductase [Clostridium botulinum]MBY6822670.1 SDR family oxidoreductase [Clostridium botulinum]MBY6833282.1 SDR family oxidoreductase [Clostridium botulinum]MBY6931661.1 SDR family oxidoreductase [Clostridium botulinum]MBY6971343.1 SDR family oxidoreductase [Clostridium botulinum]
MKKRYFEGRFENKVMIVTGGARGIGKATAIRAAKEGAKVVVVDKLKDEGEETLKIILDNGGDAIFLNLDLSDENNCEHMVKETIKKYGSLDIAINNAGVMGNPGPLHELKQENMDYTMANNFYSVYFCCKHEIKQFLAKNTEGVIVNNASIAGLTGLPGNPAYVASKHAVNGLTKNLALDYAKFNIRINSVNPAGTDTPMVKEAMEFVKSRREEAIAKGMDPAQAQSMAGQKIKTMQQREATAEEQAASILFLASDDATHMTGATVQTDGGWTSF